MLRKYSDYVNENGNMKSSTKDEETPKVQEPKIKEKEEINKVSKPKMDKVSESIVFEGKVVTFLQTIKPSLTIGLLETKKISKDKLHYIITEQENSIVILKYNLETELKLNLFIDTLLEYHKKQTNLTELFENIETEGTGTFTIIKNIPNKNVSNLITKNIKKLLQ